MHILDTAYLNIMLYFGPIPLVFGQIKVIFIDWIRTNICDNYQKTNPATNNINIT